MPDFPITVEDCCGDRIEVGVAGTAVYITLPDDGPVTLHAAQREAFAQAWVAACHEADRQAGAVDGG